MPDFTIETTYHLPAYRQRTYSAETVPDGCRLAIEDEDWDGEKLSYEDAGETFISGIWEGRDAAYTGTAAAIPSQFGETIQRKAGQFELLHGLLKLLLADVTSSRRSSDEWIARAAWAVACGEAIIAGARDPDGPPEPSA